MDVCHEGRRRVISRWEGTWRNFAQKWRERETQTASSASEVPKQCWPGQQGKWMQKIHLPPTRGAGLPNIYGVCRWTVIAVLVTGGAWRLLAQLRSDSGWGWRGDFWRSSCPNLPSELVVSSWGACSTVRIVVAAGTVCLWLLLSFFFFRP